MKYKVGKKYLLFVLIFYTLLFNELLSSAIPFFGYEDELIAVISFPIWLYKVIKKKKRDKIGVGTYIGIFFVLSLMGTIIYRFQDFVSVALPDMLLCVKFWLCLYFGKEAFSKFDIRKYAFKLFIHIKIVTWLFFILSILNYTIGLFPFFDYRYGIGSNKLFYSHPTVLVSTCSFLLLILIAIKPYIKRIGLYFILLTVVMFTTLRSKAFATVLIFCTIYYLGVLKKERFTTKSIIPFIPVVGFIGWSQIEYYFISLKDSSARAQLLLKSIIIAKDYFPIGTGFGTYGSYYSAIYYSPVYYKYGLNTIYGMSPELYSFICDSFWPMVLAQSGFLGIIFYGLAIYKLLKYIVKLKKIDLFYYISALGVMCYMIIDSTSATAFVHPLSMPMAIWLGILISNISVCRRDKDVK